MRERDVVKKIKEYMLKEYGVRMHKFHASAFTEPGVADLFGTLPPHGRAIFIEVKKPEHKTNRERYERQLRWLEFEASQGAIALMVESVEELENYLSTGSYCNGIDKPLTS